MPEAERYMAEALAEAAIAFDNGEAPIGAVVVSRDGDIIGRGHNTRELSHDITGHAEINALRSAAASLGTWHPTDCTLYVTLEPCLMCAAAIIESRISSVVYGAPDPNGGSVTGAFNLFVETGAKTRITGGILRQQCAELMQKFGNSIRG